MAGNFLEQLKRRQEAAQSPPTATEKPIEEMSNEELEEALRAAQIEALTAHLEPRSGKERTAASPASAAPSSLAEVLRQMQQGKRSTWR